MKRRGAAKQNGQDKDAKQPKINEIATQLAKSKGLDSPTSAPNNNNNNKEDMQDNGTSGYVLTEGPLHIDLEQMNSLEGTVTTSPVQLISAASTINQIANQLASSKNLATSSANITRPAQSLLGKSLLSGKLFGKMSDTLTINTDQVEVKANGTEVDGALLLKIEKVESMQPATAAALELKPVSAASAINQIAAQLASKSQQTPVSNFTAPAATSPNTKDLRSNAIVGKMSEALSLKQSPTLTKQLTQPISGLPNKMQVITQYMCRYCGQQFDSPTLMQQHIQDHVQGKAPHTCSVCGKEYRTPSKLQRHVRVHSGERPYACSVCGRRFTRSDHVKQHMKVHVQSEAKAEGKDRVKLLAIKPKDQNVCHLCNGMRFNRRQALHQHLQQQHLIQQVFTCHRCGEAYESLEEMQSHKLTHDTILNSMKDSKDLLGSAQGVAKFALGAQRTDDDSKLDILKPEKNPMEDIKLDGVLSLNSNGFYVPANLENVSALSYKLLLEGMEKMAKEAEEFEVQKKYQEELKKLNQDASQFADRKKELAEQAKIAQLFNIKVGEAKGTDDDDYKPMEEDDASSDGVAQKTMVSADGMSMFILPTSLEDSMDSNDVDDSDLDKNDEESEQNSSKESAGINREGDMDKSEGDIEEKMDGVEDGSKSKEAERSNVATDKSNKELRISPNSNAARSDGYSRPCPKSKKRGFVPTKSAPDIRIVTSAEADLSKPMVSCINPKINELIKAKVEQNLTQPPQTVTVSTQNSTFSQILSIPPTQKLAFFPNTNSLASTGALQSLLLPVISGVTSLANSSTFSSNYLNQKSEVKSKSDMTKMFRCEHCCMLFEDNAMYVLHNTLHSADEADPFTCRKCYKKLGNRLEFMAHLVWHLEPNMDI